MQCSSKSNMFFLSLSEGYDYVSNNYPLKVRVFFVLSGGSFLYFRVGLFCTFRFTIFPTFCSLEPGKCLSF